MAEALAEASDPSPNVTELALEWLEWIESTSPFVFAFADARYMPGPLWLTVAVALVEASSQLSDEICSAFDCKQSQ